MPRLRLLLCILLAAVLFRTAPAQQAASFGVSLQALRSVDHRGSFKSAAFLPNGNVVLLLDQGDGLRLLLGDFTLSTALAEAHLGTSGDTGIALALDPAGNIYVGGTSSSRQLSGTSGAVFPSPADTSLNSFVARFDSNLNLTFLTFLGAGQTALSGIAVTRDALFATGIAYSSSLPTTTGVVQTSAPSGVLGNGFVERLPLDGTSLVYATYLGGSSGSTTPAAIAADSTDRVYIAGSTSAPDLPSVNALQPTLLGSSSGFLLGLDPEARAFTFSTFVAGSGLTGLALDASGSSLLATGNLSFAQFPIANATAPIAATTYQSMLRLSMDGQNLENTTLLFPGLQSSPGSAPDGTMWVSGSLAAPIASIEQEAGPGDSYAVHLDLAGTVDQALRIGGSAANNAGYASLPSTVGPPRVAAGNSRLLVPGTLTAQTDASLAASQSFDLGLVGAPTTLLPNLPADLLPASCSPGLACSGNAGLLTELKLETQPSAQLSVDTGEHPLIVLRNNGAAPAQGLALSASGFTLSTNCAASLAPGGQCGALLTGPGPGSLTLSGSNVPTQTIAIPALAAQASTPLLFDTSSFDFGIVTASVPVRRTVAITNLGGTAQTFASAPAGVPSNAPYTLSETASTCPGTPAAHALAPNSSCTVEVTLAASNDPANDGIVHANWSLGAQDLPVSGFTQAAQLSVSTTAIDFGPQFLVSGTRLPRFLYLSNASPSPVAHTLAALPANAPFLLTDDCPSTLEPYSVCQIGLSYTQTSAPSLDTVTLTLDGGLTVLISGETLSAVPPASASNSPLVVAPGSIQFTSPVPVSGLSTETQTVAITNPSQLPVPLAISLLGDFQFATNCEALLPASASCYVTLQFAPMQVGVRQGLLSVSAGANLDPSPVPISGTATALLDIPDGPITLPETTTREPVVRWFQIGGRFPQLTASITGTGFGVALIEDDGDGHGSLPASAFMTSLTAECAQCWLGIQLLPQSPGAVTGTLQLLTSKGGVHFQVPVQGTAAAADGLLLTPMQSDFGAVPVGSSAPPVTLTLINLLPGSVSAQIQQISATGDFAVLSSTASSACSGSLMPGSACSIQVIFSPTKAGARSGSVTVQTSAGRVTVPLTGTGTPDQGLALSPTALAFETSTSQTLTLTNTGARSLQVGTPSSDNASFAAVGTCGTLAPGQACTVSVTYTAGDAQAAGALGIPVTSTDPAGQTVTSTYAVPLSGNPVSTTAGLAVFPTAADFGTSSVGALGEVRQFTLTNTSNGPVTISLAVPHNFPLVTPTGCASLAVSASCSFSVAFLPETAGSLTGSLIATATTSGGITYAQAALYLQGFATATGSLGISAGGAPSAPVSFDLTASGQTSTQVLTLTNMGSAPVTVRRLATSAPFQVSGTCSAPLQAGSSCDLTLSYSPDFQIAAGTSQPRRTDTGTLTIESDAQNSPSTVYLSGLVTPTTQASAATALPVYTLFTSALTFPDTEPGSTSTAQVITVRNTGSVPVTFGPLPALSDFSASSDCATLPPSATCSVTVSFAPVASESTAPLRTGVLAIGADAATALDFVSLVGSPTAAPLQFSASGLTFSSTVVGFSGQLSATLTNISALPVAIGAIQTTGDFTEQSGTCPTPGGTLAASQTCNLLLTFTPTATGQRLGTLTLTSPAIATTLVVDLSGTAIAGHLQVAPASVSFGTVDLGVSSTQTVQLTNTGTADLTGLQLALSGPSAAAFGAQSTCPASTLAIGATCSVQITFTPQQSGPQTASLAIGSSDPAGATVLQLTGTGNVPPGFALTVNGAPTAAATVTSGAAATFALAVTPQGGYSAPITLACTPVRSAPNAVCSLSATTVSLAGGPATASVSIKTQSGLAGAASLAPFGWLALPPLVLMRKRRNLAPLVQVLTLTLCAVLAAPLLIGCGAGPGYTRNAYTPAGTYTYRVTASSTQGTPNPSSVDVTLTVQ